uniref:MadZ n=1 Tax=Malonomonas rubra TaxID=57040 RepID=O06921_MALRU|nr:MadZ [Malonomonas rubra]
MFSFFSKLLLFSDLNQLWASSFFQPSINAEHSQSSLLNLQKPSMCSVRSGSSYMRLSCQENQFNFRAFCVSAFAGEGTYGC